MAKRKIVWSHAAKIKLFKILDFFSERNGSASYSKKLYKKINKELSLLLKQPDIGLNTDFESVRALIVNEYILFYEVTVEYIIVHTVWDCRQNPEDLIIKWNNSCQLLSPPHPSHSKRIRMRPNPLRLVYYP